MNFDIFLFALGAIGALVIVYIATQDVIPELRPVFDITAKETELSNHQDHMKKLQDEIDKRHDQLLRAETPLSTDLEGRLKTFLDSAQTELQLEMKRMQVLERDVKQGQIFSRALGFLFYILLGGAFGALLTGKVHVDGFTNTGLPSYFEAILIGAAWPTFLSVIGLKTGQQNADNKLGAFKTDIAKQLEALKKDVVVHAKEQVKGKLAHTEMAEEGTATNAISAEEVAQPLSDRIDQANMVIQSKLDLTRQMVQRDYKSIL